MAFHGQNMEFMALKIELQLKEMESQLAYP
jgi:hypothetical protein